MTPTTSAPSVFEPPATQRPWQTALLALGVYLAFNLLLPLVPPPHRGTSFALVFGIILLSTAVFMLLQLWLAQAVVGTRPHPLACVLGAIICTALFVVFYRLSVPYGLNPPAGLQFAQGLTVTLGCTFLGIPLSAIIREPNVLLPVALIAMPIDYLGAMTSIGFTQHIVNNNPGFVQHISVPVPSVGGSAHHGGLHPFGFIGPGDILFVAFFFAVVLRLNMNVRGTFWWIYGLLTVTMLVVQTVGFNIAALVPMGLAVLIANFRCFKLKREEVFAMLYAGLLIIALVMGFYLYYSHTHPPRPHPIVTESKGTAP